MYSKVLLVFIGGGLGTVLRFLLNTLINVSSLPQFSTLFINVLGSFLFGIIYSIVAENSLVSIFPTYRHTWRVYYLFTIYL